MAASARDLLAGPSQRFSSLSPTRKVGLLAVLAAVLIAVAGSLFWSGNPEYKVLFSNLGDRDGGLVIDALQKMNVPYRMADGGGAILVPADRVYETRLKLGAEGLPKGSGVGFELLDNEKLGTSQFVEQVNYQRGLEGELAQSIKSLAAVSDARVHLALPRQSVFVRDQEQPTASVVLTLYSGRQLEESQIAGIVHLVSSSVPKLSPERVNIVDQSGRLLTRPNGGVSASGLNASQLDYVHQMERQYAKRIEDILTPILGPSGVRAEVSADVDFSQTEQTSETYNPNTTLVRSEQRSTDSSVGAGGTMGVPGALSNQPPGAANAPFTAPTASAAASVATAPTSSHAESVINYELDKTISHTKQQVGVVKRLSVAAVVNNRPVVNSKGQVEYKPLTPAELTQVTNLVRDAIGFNTARGDSVNVVNMAFNGVQAQAPEPELPLWEQPWILDLAKYGVWLILGILLIFGVLRPLMKGQKKAAGPEGEDAVLALDATGKPALAVEDSMPELTPALAHAGASQLPPPVVGYDADKQVVRELVNQDPRKAAQVIKEWLNDGG
ncbi:flagellar basal-body MS-ring/collar protein FliF [Thermithiobacillus plumbiphilus]|uniref:Flagellar M-ring protein n=1 Tax=Thermithiobacillus plumbiphilus TaxID=1729899 RepID=A0ABU9DAK6_9PROT